MGKLALKYRTTKLVFQSHILVRYNSQKRLCLFQKSAERYLCTNYIYEKVYFKW